MLVHYKSYMEAMTHQQPSKIFCGPNRQSSICQIQTTVVLTRKTGFFKQKGQEGQLTWIFHVYLMAESILNSYDPTVGLFYAGYCWCHDKKAYISKGFWRNPPPITNCPIHIALPHHGGKGGQEISNRATSVQNSQNNKQTKLTESWWIQNHTNSK